MKEGEQPKPTLFDQINEYLKKEAPEDIPDPTVQGIAERIGIPRDVLNHWLANDKQFKEEMTRIIVFQTSDPMKDGSEFDYFEHASEIQYVLEETKKSYTV
jgi:hypothetical protein